MMQYDINLQTSSDNEDSTNSCPWIQALWQAVISQAFIDASSRSKKKFYRIAKRKAIIWLLSDSEDFITVCEMAGVSHTYIKTKAYEILQKKCPSSIEEALNYNARPKTIFKKMRNIRIAA